ncbi:hypothetical protein Ancab_004890 [Ancistrocladus abbreviatus]
MEFEKRKAATLASMNSTEKDKSPKGTIDAPILPLLNTLNHHPSYFTTSSCSGRISVFSHPNTINTSSGTATKAKKSKGGTWLFITHEPADPNSVLNLLFPSNLTQSNSSESTYPSDLVFRFEPFIVAVECKDVGWAQSLVSLAISCGFRESGITSMSSKRVIVAIRCSIRLEVPLGSTSEIMVSKDYVRYIVELANEKMAANRLRTDGFLDALRRNGFGGDKVGECVNGVLERSAASIYNEGYDCGENHDVDANPGRTTNSGLLGPPGCTLPILPINVVGEPLERLFLWGHSSCILNNKEKILVYGGFGGIGRHARRNDCFLLDPSCGTLAALIAKDAPSPRLGHTSLLVGDLMFVIGGRADPVNILNDVWIFDTAKNEWKFVDCTGSAFAPRHRHAAAVLGSKIYIFGGLNNGTLHSSLLVLHVDKLQWSEVHAHGEWPCPRHSHSLIAHESKLYMFGGYDGEKALGDLYTFDVQECRWEKLKTSGKAPYPRFSHSMFVYKDCLGIIGGCPVRQHCQELVFLDLRNYRWKNILLNSAGKELFVRSTANVVTNDLIMIGGGASCYAFGTKFSEPVKINLLPLMELNDASVSSQGGEKPRIHQYRDTVEKTCADVGIIRNGAGQLLDEYSSLTSETSTSAANISYWVLQIERKYAKLGKDILKKFGWLDLKRKVYSRTDGSHICFPVTEKFSGVFQEKLSQSEGQFLGQSDTNLFKSFAQSGFSLDEFSYSAALDVLWAYGASIVSDGLVEMRKAPRSPLQVLREAVAYLIEHKGLPAQLLDQLPSRWERLGDIIVLPVTSFKDPVWDTVGSELWKAVAKSLHASRLARQGRVAATGTRDSGLEILVGDDGWVEHCECGILYSFDATKCTFSWGNLSEKLRMGCLDCKGEVVVDLFAGIGYFVLPFLVRSNAKLVYACEWNPSAVEALRRNLQVNSVSDRCIILEGDNRLMAPKGVADRVCLGLLPSSEGSWITAVRALRREGGMLHIHGNVKDTEEDSWTEHVVKSISEIAESEGRCWDVSKEHVERVKWYAPHIRHLVVDVRCRQIHR